MSNDYELDLVKLNPLALKKPADCAVMIDMVQAHIGQVEARVRDLVGQADKERALTAQRNYEILHRALVARKVHLELEAAARPDTRLEQRFMAAAKAVLSETEYAGILRLAQDGVGGGR